MKNPWKGLASYQEIDNLTYKFCGRRKSVKEVARLIENNLFVTLYGRTGIGKTSLLQAGVFPVLRRRDFLPVIVRFSDMVEDDKRNFAEYIIYRVENEVEKNSGIIKISSHDTINPSENDMLWRYFASRRFFIFDAGEEKEVSPVVVLDQFEENLLESSKRRKAWELMCQIYSLIDDNKIFPSGYHSFTNFRIVVSIREDDLFRLEDCIDSNSLTEFKYNRYRLVPLTDEEAAEIIEEPGKEILPESEELRNEVVRRILDLVKGETPENMSTLMLSLVCHLLFESIDHDGNPGIITPEVIDNLDKKNLLENFYLNVVKDIPPSEREYIEDILVDSHRRRNFINKDEFIEHCSSYKELSKGNNRILHETNNRIELVHDLLASVIFDIRERRKEEERIKELEKRQIEERRKNRRRRRILMAIIAVVAAVGGIFAWQTYRIREGNQRLLLNQSRAIASKAMELIKDGDSYTATLLALEALPKDLSNPNRPYCVEAESALRCAVLSDAAILNNTAVVNSIAISPDGKLIVSGSDDGTVRLWDASTGEQIGEPLKGHTDCVNSVAFSPDGKLIVSGSGDDTVRLWDASTGEQIGEPLKGHTNSVQSVAFSPDGKLIVSGSWDYTVRLWDASTGEQIGEPLKGHTASIESVAISPDGKLIVSGSWDYTVRLWDLSTGEQIGEPLRHTNSVQSVAFSPDGKWIVSGSWDNILRIWDLSTGEQIAKSVKGHTDSLYSVAFSPDVKFIVSGSADETVRIWDLSTGEQIGEPLLEHPSSVQSVAFSPDGKRIVSGSMGHTVRLWDLSTGEQIGEPLMGHTGPVYSVAFSPDGKLIVSSSADETVRIWDLSTGEQIGEPLKGHTNWVYSVAFSPNGKQIVSGSYDKTVRLWDLSTGEQIGEPLKGHTNFVHSVAFSPDGKLIVSGSWDHTVRLWDASTGEQIGEPLKGHRGAVQSVAFSPDGKLIVSGSLDHTVRLWDASTGEQIGEPLKGHTDDVNSVAFSPNGKQIVSGSDDKTVRIWEWVPLQDLIDEARNRFKNRELTPQERSKYYLE